MGHGKKNRKGPGKAHREGITIFEVMKMFPTDRAAEKWFAGQRWPDGPHCPHCGSINVQDGTKHKTMPYRCRDCRKFFSVRTGTSMQCSQLGYRTWAVAVYMVVTNIKGVSSMHLHRELGVTQKTAWHLLQRLRDTYESGETVFSGPVEADETFIGGLEKNKHSRKKLRAGRGAVGKTTVAGMKDRATGRVKARVVEKRDAETLHPFVEDHTNPDAVIYTDEFPAYRGMDREHESVKHKTGEYVDGMAHTNGLESFWNMLKKGFHGTHHKMSPKHLQRYVDEFAGRHNIRDRDTIDQMKAMARSMVGKRLKYEDLIADNGLPSGAGEGGAYERAA